MAHGVVSLEANSRASSYGSGVSFTGGVDQIELIAAELRVVHVRQLCVVSHSSFDHPR